MSAVKLPQLKPDALLPSDWDDEPTQPDGRRDLPMRELIQEPRDSAKGEKR